MRKKRLLLIAGSLIILTIYLVIFLVNNLYGPQANDDFAKEKIRMLESLTLPDKIKMIGTTDFIGKQESDGQFIIRVGIAVKSHLTIQELESSIKTLPEFENAEIFLYELHLANEYGFTGIQKEVWGTETKDNYLVSIIFEPRTIFDKRNN